MIIFDFNFLNSFISDNLDNKKRQAIDYCKINQGEIGYLRSILKKASYLHDVVILRNLIISDEDQLKFLVEHIFKKNIFRSERKNMPEIETFQVEPFLVPTWKTLSETSKSGGFHTDFWLSERPPEFIMLHCIDADPKHPYYGRNQYVSASSIFYKFKALFGQIELEKFIHHDFKYLNNITAKFIDNQKTIRYHESLIDPECKYSYELSVILREISLSECSDFVLNKNDIAIFNNINGLHRRGEASIKFSLTLCQYESRNLNTLRFN